MKCKFCDGDGSVIATHYSTTTHPCSGSSTTTYKQRDKCKYCDGTGVQIYEPCSKCHGSGHIDTILPGPVSSCSFCEGRGSYMEEGSKIRSTCTKCSGKGSITGPGKTISNKCVECDGNGNVFTDEAKQEDKRKRVREAEMRATESARILRLREAGKCLKCERSLSAWDKLLNRNKHRSCL